MSNNTHKTDFAKAIIVADRAYFPLLYSFRSSHPDKQIKIWSTFDLLDRVSCRYDLGANDPVPYLLGKLITYPNAQIYLSLLRVADLSKNAKLSSLHNELKEQGYLHFDELGEKEVTASSLYLFEMQEDKEIHGLLERKSIPFSDLSIVDLGFSPLNSPSSHPPVYLFSDKFEQYSYLYSKVRERLLAHPEESASLSVLAHNEGDEFYAKTIASLFNVPSSFLCASSLLSLKPIKDKVASICASSSFSFGEEEAKDPDLLPLYQLVTHYGLASLPFSFAYASLLDLLSANKLSPEPSAGLSFIASPIIDPKRTFYVTNFQDGDFFKLYSDKGVFSDEELLACSCNPSYVKSALDKRLKKNFLLYDNIAFLSRAAKHLSDKIYKSPFLEEFKWKEEEKSYDKEAYYTFASERLFRACQLDKAFYHAPMSEEGLLTYDHSFALKRPSPIIRSSGYSVSQIERYISCPFRYLLDRLLPSDNSAIRITGFGTLNHAMMEDIYEEEYDFDALFAKASEKLKESYRASNVPFGSEEEAILEIYGHWLKKITMAIRGERRLEEKAEQKIVYTIKDEDGTPYTFYGRIDKILFVNASGKRHYVIVDYKSGSEEFNIKGVFLGASTQLPLYALALSDSGKDIVGEASFAGFAIHHTFVNSLSPLYPDGWIKEEVSLKSLSAKGVMKADPDFYRALDPSSIKKDGSIKKTGGTFFKSSNFFVDLENGQLIKNARPYVLKDLLMDAKQGLLSLIKKINNNEFPIAPTSKNLDGNERDLACSYCSYGDICYKNKAADSASYADQMTARFALSTMEEEEENDEQD